MQRLEVSCEVRHTYTSLGAEGLRKTHIFTTANDVATAWRHIAISNCLIIICSTHFTKLPIHLCRPFQPGTRTAATRNTTLYCSIGMMPLLPTFSPPSDE